MRIAAAPAVLTRDWPRVLPSLGVGLLALSLLFNREVVAAIQTWNASTAYNHCFLVIPITLYLLWDRRFDILDVPIRPTPVCLLLCFPLAVAWLAAERLGIMEGRQLVVLSFVEVLFFAVLGTRMWWAVAGPLLYLYFLVPFGEFLTPRLQDVTTFFIRHGLEILGIPAFIDGYIIEIPQGTFFVAEACAGLRFLIASVAFGCLYALTMYRSPVRRGVFILISIIVPIFANGLRGIGIVYLGYLLGSAQAAAADHIIYGWVFFSAVILLLLALGLPFRQDELPTRLNGRLRNDAVEPVSVHGAFAAVCGVAMLAAIGPAVAAVLVTTAAMQVTVPATIPLSPECEVRPSGTGLDVPSAIASALVTCGGVPMQVTWEALSPRSTAAPVMAERRRLVSRALTEGLSEQWLTSDDGIASAWRIMTSNDPAFVIAVAIWVDGKPVRPGLAMRLRLALNSVTESAYAPMLVTVTPLVDWEQRDPADLRNLAAELPKFLAQHVELNEAVGAMSRQP